MANTEFFSTTLFADAALKAYYRAEDNNDSSSNGKTLTEAGTVNHAAAKFNNGFSATFTDTTYLTNASVYAPGTGDVTLGCWFLKNGAPGDDFTPTILSLGDSGGTTRCTIEATKTNGYLQTQFVNTGSNVATDNVNICDNVQHLLGMTREGTAVKIYLDGTEVGSTTSSKNITGDDLLIGCAAVSSGFDFIGAALIDDIFVMSRALSGTEWSDLYAGNLLIPEVANGFYHISQ